LENLKEIESSIYEVLSPITNTYFRDRTSEEIRLQKGELLAIVNDAAALAVKMSQQASKLEIVNKEWFHNNGREVGHSDDRVKGRLAEGDDNPGTDLTVDLILTPGFLKYGNDNAEHLDKYSVWIPARVDIRNSRGRNAPTSAINPRPHVRLTAGARGGPWGRIPVRKRGSAGQ
jgi:hypothetical protein